MSGTIQMLIAGSGAVLPPAVVNPLSPMSVVATSSAPASTFGVQITFLQNGSVTLAASGSTLSGVNFITKWWSGAPIAPVAQYWIQVSPTLGIPPAQITGDVVGGFTPLWSSNRSWIVSHNASVGTITIAVSISSDSGGSVIVATGTITITLVQI